MPVTHAHIKTHLSSQAFKWGDNISAYNSRMSFGKEKVMSLLTNSEWCIITHRSLKAVPRTKRNLFLFEGSKRDTEEEDTISITQEKM